MVAAHARHGQPHRFDRDTGEFWLHLVHDSRSPWRSVRRRSQYNASAGVAGSKLGPSGAAAHFRCPGAKPGYAKARGLSGIRESRGVGIGQNGRATQVERIFENGGVADEKRQNLAIGDYATRRMSGIRPAGFADAVMLPRSARRLGSAADIRNGRMDAVRRGGMTVRHAPQHGEKQDNANSGLSPAADRWRRNQVMALTLLGHRVRRANAGYLRYFGILAPNAVSVLDLRQSPSLSDARNRRRRRLNEFLGSGGI